MPLYWIRGLVVVITRYYVQPVLDRHGNLWSLQAEDGFSQMYQAKMEEMMGRQEKEEEALNQEAKDAIRELEAIQASIRPARSPVVVGPLLPCTDPP